MGKDGPSMKYTSRVRGEARVRSMDGTGFPEGTGPEIRRGEA
jgi:hypothetical protein